MRPEPNNDIDLLLRKLSRRNGAPVSEIDEQHLDADELNSYVANALPSAARARYTAHLADCSTCRKLVVELSAAQGPVAVQQTPPSVAPSGLMSFLASLFSPMVLRYSVPALGLIVVAAIGFVALRQSGRNAPTALNDGVQTKQAEGVLRDQQTSENASPDANSRGSVETSQQQPENKAEKREEQVAKALTPATREAAPVIANQPAEAAGAGAAAGAAAAEPPPAPKAAADEDRSRIAELQKEKKTEVAQPAGVSDSAKARAADAEKDDSSKNVASTVTVAPGTVARKDIGVRPAKSPETAAAGRGQDMKRAPAPATGSLHSAETESAAETRSVAGRRFRKSGRGWIDTGYDSSKPITNLARGSDQYRALIADEPSIRTIADELDGEVIIVWKSRTYRIR